MASISLDGIQAQTQAAATKRKPGEKRKALLIGIRYTETAAKSGGDEVPELPHAHEDLRVIKSLLKDHFEFEEKDIRTMRDIYSGKHTVPTRTKILQAIKKLIRDAQAGDHYVFYFSGHGSQVPNLNPENDPEEDGKDEVIWPADVCYDASKPDGEEVKRFILDDELKEHLVDKLPPDTRLTVILDCCHSGTGVDLPSAKAEEDVDWIMSPISPEKANGNSFANYTGFSTSGAGSSEPSKVPSKMKLGNSAHAQVDKTEEGIARMVSAKDRVNKEDSKLVTSFSACVDKDVGVDGPKGGVLTQAINNVLRRKCTRTYKELMHAIAKDMVLNLKDAREDAIRDNWTLNCPKPVLGSNVALDKIYDTPFTF